MAHLGGWPAPGSMANRTGSASRTFGRRSPRNGDGQRPNPGVFGCSKASSRIIKGQSDISI